VLLPGRTGLAAVFEELRRAGIGAGAVLVAGDPGGTLTSEVPLGIVALGGGPDVFAAVLGDQLRRRENGELPLVDPEWTLTVEGLDPTLERAHEALLTLADGAIGTSGAPLLSHPAATPRVIVGGVYEGEGSESRPLRAPHWVRLAGELAPVGGLRRVLDLRGGLLFEDLSVADGPALRSVRFSSVSRPGTVALRAEGEPACVETEHALVPPRSRAHVRAGRQGRRDWIQVRPSRGGVAAAAGDRLRHDGPLRRLDRLGAYVAGAGAVPGPELALAALDAAEQAGFERLLHEHRAAWGACWEDADVRIEGDPQLQQAVRLALFQLMGSVAEQGETALGARGLTGLGYRGHVFWDTDVFVLPFLAATRPEAARTLLEYRIRRLPAARREARSAARAGARFPWESARSGRDVTPGSARLHGKTIQIRTGALEEHIVADVAWAAGCYLDWTGDESFRVGPGLTLFVETARYWASRIRLDGDGRGHIDGVIGPDEYHEAVDDNAFTNVMARWNLRRAAAAVVTTPHAAVEDSERARWLALSDALVDGYDDETGLYQQFAGFSELEPLVIEEIAPRRPVAAELLLGHERLRGSQVVKQADVLMLHHLVPDEVAPGSLLPNLLFYEPRTAHGSSLSPGIHASLFARAGMLAEALEALRLTSRIDLDDLTQTTAAGLHLAAMGSLWQALVAGFAGVRPAGAALRIDPKLPDEWDGLELRLRFRGARVRIHSGGDALTVTADQPVHVLVAARRRPMLVPQRGLRLERHGQSWREEKQ
jgi:trehalose/maltose hydrolase-like predicted phosphorylase